MKLKSSIRPVLAIFAVNLIIMSFSACRQKSSPGEGKQLTAEEYAASRSAAVDSTQKDTVTVIDSALFTYAMAMEIIQPGYICDENFFASLFGDLGLPMQYSERYISDEDFGGDSPAISYCWGNDVKYENYKLTPTSEKYFGSHFNFFFDDSRKTGRVNCFSIITSYKGWYEQFIKDMKADGLKYVSNVDPDVYGKKGKMYHKKAKPIENSTEQPFYYVYDFSTDGVYDIEIGYDGGLDI